MTRKRIIRNAGLVAAALCLPLFAQPAQAGRGDRDRGDRREYRDRDHDRGHHYERQHNRPKIGFGFNISFGSGHRDRGRNRRHHRRHGGHGSYSSGSAYVVRGNQCGGYWKRVYCPPVYETYYDSCGRKRQRCVSAATWKRVWVEY